MATTRDGGRLVYKAGADLSEKQYFIVKRGSTAGECVLSSAGSDNHLGVLQNAPASGDAADIVGRHSQNTGKVRAGGTLTPGAALTSDANGEAVVTTTEDDQVFGHYLGDANAADGDIVEFAPSDKVIPPAT